MFTIGGEFDLAAAEELRRSLDAALADRPAVVELDLAAVTFIDCAGLTVLLRCLSQCRAGGSRGRVVATSLVVQRLLDLTEPGGDLRSLHPVPSGPDVRSA